MRPDLELRLLQLDHDSHPPEQHDYPEGLFVARGAIHLTVDGKRFDIKKGGMFVVPPGALHSVEGGGDDAVVIFN